MTLRRAIVQGWDSGTSQPKGVSTAVDVRQSVSPLAARAGVFRTASNACAASGTATMDVELQPFTVAIESTLGGYYIVVEDDVAPVELDPADSTNDRIDVIYVIQNDYQVDAGEVDSTVEYGVATGTPGVTPAAPTVPTGAYALWECEVPANATDTLDGVVFTPRFVWTAPVGATMPVRVSTELAAWTPAPGARAVLLSDKRMYTRQVTSAVPSGAWIADSALFSVDRSSAQSLSISGWWVIASAFASPTINDLGTWTGAAGTFQVVHAGRYRVTGFLRYSSPSNPFSMQITKNSGGPDVGVIAEAFVNSSTSSQTTTRVVTLAAGDVVRLLGYTSTAVTVSGAHLSVELLALT